MSLCHGLSVDLSLQTHKTTFLCVNLRCIQRHARVMIGTHLALTMQSFYIVFEGGRHEQGALFQ